MIALLAAAALLATPQPVRAFAAAPMYLAAANEVTVDHVTVRMPLRVTLGGRDLRVTLSNAHGHQDAQVTLVALHVDGRDYPVTFGGSASVTLPVGAPLVSDPVAVHVAAEQVIELDVRLDQATVLAAVHRDRLNPATIIGDDGKVTTTIMRPFLAAVDLTPDKPAATIVAFGDSISDWDCNYATPQPCTWEAELARRLAAAGKPYAVANAAISADRILLPTQSSGLPWGELSALARFDRDVLAVPNASYVVMMLGINDIGLSGLGGEPVVSANAVIGGLKQLILRAHAHGLKIYAAPIMPFRGAGYYTPEKEAVRMAVNAWMHDSGAFDGLVDFAGAVGDPVDPTHLAAKFDTGDHLHPNGDGQRAMGDAIDLKLFK